MTAELRAIFPRQAQREIERAGYQYEQIERTEAEIEIAKLNVRFIHDPLWRSRFWSIQCVHDVIEGKRWHWFWSPMKGAFGLAQIAFIAAPVMLMINSRASFWQIMALMIAIECALVAFQNFIEWFYWWRFNRIRARMAGRRA